MNDNSSKTHCCAELKLYTKIDKNSVRINCFKFFDLCGSERTEKSLAPSKNSESDKADYWMAMGANWSLYHFARTIWDIAAVTPKKPLTGGEKIPSSIWWRGTGFTKNLKSSLNGLAFTAFILCFSQHPKNGGETFTTANFGE